MYMYVTSYSNISGRRSFCLTSQCKETVGPILTYLRDVDLMTTIRGGRERGRGPDGFTINDLSKTILTLYIRQQKQIRVQLHSSFGGGTRPETNKERFFQELNVRST